MKSVFFYGSIKEGDYDKVNRFLSKFIPKLLERDYQIITREGTPDPTSGNHVWLDNLVLDIACNYRDTHQLDFNTVISLRLDDNKPSEHRRKIITLQSSDRFSGYREILEKCDLVIAIGGTGGVYRLGLVAAATNYFFIPLSIAEGDAQTLARQLKDYLVNNYSDKLPDYILDSEIEPDEMEKFLNVISSCINKPTGKKEEISDEQFIEYIENHSDKLKNLSIKHLWKILIKLPVSWIIALFSLVLAVIVLFVLQLVLK